MQDEVIATVQRHCLDALEILRPWVLCNSYSRYLAGVNRMGKLLEGDFASCKLTVKRVAGNEVGDHLFLCTEAWEKANPAERIVLVGHHDTVFPPGVFEDWDLQGDILKGPGVLDMKGGLLTILLAFRALHQHDLLHGIPIAFVCVGDEEIGSKDSAPHVQEFCRGAGGALVFEAGRAEDAIVTRRKGTGALHVVAHGKSAHAGNHHQDGINAIAALASYVLKAEACTDYDRGITVNVGLIEGGEARNTVPPKASCQIDFRVLTAEDGEATVTKLRTLAETCAQESGARFEVTGGLSRSPLTRIEGTQELLDMYASAADASGLGSKEAGLYGGGSDANTLCAIGVPAIDGIGLRGSGFHTHKEVIEVSSISLRSEALVRFLLAWRDRVGVAP